MLPSGVNVKCTVMSAGHVFEREKMELQERYEGEMAALRKELEELQVAMETEREHLAREARDSEDQHASLEQAMAQQIRDELQVSRGRGLPFTVMK